MRDDRSERGRCSPNPPLTFEGEAGGRLIRTAIVSEAVRSQIRAMPYHRFKLGQTVVAPSGGQDALIPSGPYVIVRLLPWWGGSRTTGSRARSTGMRERCWKIRSGWSSRSRRERSLPLPRRFRGVGSGSEASAASWREPTTPA